VDLPNYYNYNDMLYLCGLKYELTDNEVERRHSMLMNQMKNDLIVQTPLCYFTAQK